ncbi:MAG: OmpH family outer membrane protein [Prevotella sp.]|nr:OmpH family outer membrane protein [Prevotella sp.]
MNILIKQEQRGLARYAGHEKCRMAFKYLLAIIFSVVSLCASAQSGITATVKFGFLSYEQALKSMPDYAVTLSQIAKLKDKYDEEAKRVETDFNAKYEDFLDTQADMPKSILEKRQSELQELLNKNIEFKAESRRLLAQAEKDAFAPLHEKLQRALKVIGEQDGYAFIINTDNNACPFINPAQGTDVTQTVVRLLQKL